LKQRKTDLRSRKVKYFPAKENILLQKELSDRKTSCWFCKAKYFLTKWNRMAQNELY